VAAVEVAVPEEALRLDQRREIGIDAAPGGGSDG
jgi:hypothetical protein